MYYSILGIKGLVLGAEARLLKRTIEVKVKHPRLPHPIYLRLRTTDVALCREILVRGQYDCDLAHSPRVIVDAGANVGLASIFYAHKYPDAQIIAIEPEPSNFEMLLKNVAAYENVTAIKAALWNKNGEIDILDTGFGHTTFQAREAGSTPANVVARVRALTVDQLMIELNLAAIDLLKIDIEGSEQDVFADPSRWIKRVEVIAIELHEHMRPGLVRTIREATQEFEIAWTQGEITYLARKGRASSISTGQVPSDSILPLRILGAD